MLARENRRLMILWAGLVVLTLLSWALGANHGQAVFERRDIVTWGVLAMAAIKVRLILRGFMEVDHASAWLRHLTDAWLVLAVGLLALIYTMTWAVMI